MKPKNKDIKKNKKAWPTKDAMKQVYAMNLWGGSDYDRFYSGQGSHDPEFVTPYVEKVAHFLKSFKDSLSVCDLGCGDFNVGKRLVNCAKNYVAVDIVPELIAYNKQFFKSEHVQFQCMDIAVDEWPTADVVLLRQVLQHLSNTEIQQITKKLPSYKYMILTEHLPKGEFVPNKDIISGQGIRLKKRSGVVLTAPPFNLKVKKERRLLSINLPGDLGIIVTTLFEM